MKWTRVLKFNVDMDGQQESFEIGKDLEALKNRERRGRPKFSHVESSIITHDGLLGEENPKDLAKFMLPEMELRQFAEMASSLRIGFLKSA